MNKFTYPVDSRRIWRRSNGRTRLESVKLELLTEENGK